MYSVEMQKFKEPYHSFNIVREIENVKKDYTLVKVEKLMDLLQAIEKTLYPCGGRCWYSDGIACAAQASGDGGAAPGVDR